MTSNLLNDPYRDWLRKTLSPEMGRQKADQLVLAAVTRRGWPAMQAFGPREVVAVLQDVYASLREDMGDARADRWIEAATQSLSEFMQTVPAPVTQEPARPVKAPTKWGRRAHDLPLLLARVHNETAQRSLDAIRVTPELSGLERAAEWDVQATHAELRRWEAEDKLSSMRAEHSQSETAEQVRSARAQERLLDLTVRELEAEIRASTHAASARAGGTAGTWNPQVGAPTQQGASLQTQLAHNRLMLSQTRAFLEVFAPLADEQGANVPATIPDTDLEAQRLSVNVQLHPNVLRARHLLNYAEWQTKDGPQGIDSQGPDGTHEQSGPHPRVVEARRMLAHAEAEAAQLLQATLDTARQHQEQWLALQARLEDTEKRVTRLNASGGDPLSLARVQFEAQQTRAAMRINANRLNEALGLLNALSGN
ncbi:hypothetical protein Q0M94_15330 [Deinococcus radiomollis]|uniref:hypothetical protein n=1 Tax=Deinococcus radiomollis TaxID=468916 RepID=UPI00389160AD